MSSAQYLYRRPSGIYFVRLCVPARLKAAVGKGEVHRTTGCRDFRLAKIVAAELAAHWHRAIESLASMDAGKIKAGSVELLGGGFIPLAEASDAMGAQPAQLAARLAQRGADFFVVAKNWLGWAVASIHDDLEHEHDELGQVKVVISPAKLGGPSAQSRFSGRLQIRYPEEALEAASEGAGVCQFLVWPSRDLGFVVDLPGQTIRAADLEVSREQVEGLREALAAQLAPDELAAQPPVHLQARPLGIKFSELAAEAQRFIQPCLRASTHEVPIQPGATSLQVLAKAGRTYCSSIQSRRSRGLPSGRTTLLRQATPQRSTTNDTSAVVAPPMFRVATRRAPSTW